MTVAAKRLYGVEIKQIASLLSIICTLEVAKFSSKVADSFLSFSYVCRYYQEKYMSIASAKALYYRLIADKAFLEQFERAASQEERIQILQAAGYEFTLEDWKAAIAQISALNSSGDELNDLDLRSVGGGAIALTPACGNLSIFKNIEDLLARH